MSFCQVGSRIGLELGEFGLAIDEVAMLADHQDFARR